MVRADEKLSAFVELERQVLTVTFISHPFMPDSSVAMFFNMPPTNFDSAHNYTVEKFDRPNPAGSI